MPPPTNGAMMLTSFPPPMGGMSSDALLFPSDGFSFSADDFFAPPPLAADPTRLPLAPSACLGHGYGSGSNSSTPDAITIAAPTSPRVTTAILAPVGGSSSAPARAPAMPLVPSIMTQRTSCYRGVTRHRWTGRYEAHLWDNTCRREGQKRKGRQGGYEKEDQAARAYDLAALKYWGANATTNFPKESYIREIKEMQSMSRHDLVASLRRKSSGFSRGASMYRGVTRHHHHGRWQARIGRVAGNKDLYLGTFATQEEAAEAYDIAALKFRGENAVTNFESSRYNLEAIARMDLPINVPRTRLESHKPAAPEAQGQIAPVSAPPFSQQPSNNLQSHLFHSLLPLPPCEPLQALPVPAGYSFGEPSWPFGDVEQKVQLDSKMEVAGGLLQLANYAAN
ncbi:hypothetical protein BRADI_1g64240v3 [Brachypodium distachyon]|uniref:AP2/ERF domain-containing protein n=1 Tax=Brachypodium distachyon TaxID=15368 RepID=I1H651_BRADI|nr:hypothetical protein BRADI_1g64240v3 [Brachypodium distachyon]